MTTAKKAAIAIIVIASVLLFVLLFSIMFYPFLKYSSILDFLYPTSLEFYDGEKIINASACTHKTAFVTESGAVYISGDVNEGLGIPESERKTYTHYGKYVKIFDKDAILVDLDYPGGVILTANGEIYAFCEGIEKYSQPALVSVEGIGKCIDVHSYGTQLIILTEDGDLYKYDLKSEEEPLIICENVISISECTGDELVAVTEEGDILMYEKIKYSNSFVTFDVGACKTGITACVDVGIPNHDRAMYAYIDGEGVANIIFRERGRTSINKIEGAVSLVAVTQGIAVMDSKGNVTFYEYIFVSDDISDGMTMTDGRVIATNAAKIAAGGYSRSLAVVTLDGELLMFGDSKYGSWGDGYHRSHHVDFVDDVPYKVKAS